MERMESFLSLTAFVRAVEREGFSAAARDLDVTPSAVSKLVSRLERKLGVALLHRTTRRARSCRPWRTPSTR
jgi:DNA-binding transcriptional LysR family regulator